MGFLDWFLRKIIKPKVLDGWARARRRGQINALRKKRERARAICMLPQDGRLPTRKARNPMTGRTIEVEYDDGLKGIAKALGLKPSRVAKLSFSPKKLYTTFTRPKPAGGERTIHAPVRSLKYVQRRILDRILNWVDLPDCVHGFRRYRSLATGAAEHVGKEMVLRMDIEDFFPSIHFGRVLGLFRSLQFSTKHAFILARLTTADGVLPQGAPTSPAIANAVCRRLDRRLMGAAQKQGISYTRYADDMTFSGPAEEVKRLVPFVRKVVGEEGFTVADKKVRLMRRGRRQIVTGVVVNDKLSVPRYYRRWLRATIHHLRTRGATPDGLTAAQLRSSLLSHAHYIKMVNADQGNRLLADLREVLGQQGGKGNR
ncbi:MAG: RNA-directed DNA polymerase [Planctomycetes bacterium]|nr:RNA-directed DNA polymerase [Planctomycetota bacterium]